MEGEKDQKKKMRRVAKLLQHLEHQHDSGTVLRLERWETNAGKPTVKIGDVVMELEPPPQGCEHLVPVGYLDPEGESQEVLRILRFLMQKDTLGQDSYLIGPPGPLRREIVFKYCELVQRPLEYVPLSQDTTESDLKQRREISHGTAKYVDCAAVRAAVMGSVLVLDGIEKAERNVMPLLNNLLENREMALEDGRFLVHPKRFDTLLQEHSQEEIAAWKLVRTSHRFRVIALGLPVPRYPGSALDPPFRSRFQARDVASSFASEQLDAIQSQLSVATNPLVPRLIVQAAAVLHDLRHSEGVSAMSAVPEFPQNYEYIAADLLASFPSMDPRAVINFFFPFPQLMAGSGDDRRTVVEKVLARFSLLAREAFIPPSPDAAVSSMVVHKNGEAPPVHDQEDQLVSAPLCNYVVEQVVDMSGSSTATVQFRMEALNAYSFEYLKEVSQTQAVITVHSGEFPATNHVPGFVETMTNMEQFSRMVQAHSVGDFLLIGEKGGGKSALVNYFAKRLGYRVEHIPLYKDITARNLLQRRITHPNGDTDWENSSLVVAALTGRLAVLDGVEQMIPGTLASLQLLVTQREARLPDGCQLVSLEKFEILQRKNRMSREEMLAAGVVPIHPSFRIIALARPVGAKSGGAPTGTWRDWLGAEIQSMFTFVHIGPLRIEEQKFILRTLAPRVHVEQVDRLMSFAALLRSEVEKDEMLSTLLTAVSLRSMIRISRRISVQVDEDEVNDPHGTLALHEAILRAALSRFLPPIVLESLLHMLKRSGIHGPPGGIIEAPEGLSIVALEGEEADAVKTSREAIGVVKIGSLVVDVMPPKDVLLIPDILFYDNPRQALSMREMIKDWISGQHLLLIGNQGVGKNKLADRMLQLLKLPREYIQLHRDTTVQNLTSNPTIVDGVLKYEDSPLVRAAREGRVLVVDEADKAPTHVTAILKALVEDRSMLLSDGRRIIDPELMPDSGAAHGPEIIPLHPEFRLIALANRPGFPFHGNNFYAEVGDSFAAFAIDNPDAVSEMYLLKQYGPDVPEDTLRKLIASFDELRKMSDDGQLSYPYSTRELTAIVKHMQRFPDDGVDRILRNVFDFDNYSHEEKQLLMDVFARNGVPFAIGASSFHVNTGRNKALPPPKLIETWSLAPKRTGQVTGTGVVSARSPTVDAARYKASVTELSDVLRLNQMTKTHMWPLKPPQMEVTLQRKERPSTVFTEELYSFTLPQGLILGVTSLKDGSLAAAVRSHSFMLFQVDKDHSACTVYDLHAAVPSDGMYRIAPNSANVFAMSGSAPSFAGDRSGSLQVLVQNPSTGNMLALDLSSKTFAFLELPPSCSRQGAKIQILQCPEPHRDRFLMYQRGQRYVTVVDYAKSKIFSTSVLSEDPVRYQLPFTIERVDVLSGNSWLVSTTGDRVKSQSKPVDTFHLVLDETAGEFIVQRLNRREPTPEAADSATLPTFAAGSTLDDPPGGLQDAGHDVRMLQLKAPDASPGERTLAIAVDLPSAFEKGSRANVYQIDNSILVGDSGTQAEEPQPDAEENNNGKKLGSQAKQARMHAMQLEKSNIMAVLREAPEKMMVEIDLYDINNANKRTLSVSLEDNALENADPDLRIRSEAKVDNKFGTPVRHSPNLAALKNALSPSQLNMFAMRRATIGEASQRLFIAELSDAAICTVDCLGVARVWLVQDLAIRQAFATWRKLVGKAEEAPLKILYEGKDQDDDVAKAKGKGKGNGQGQGQGQGQGEGEGDGNGNGNGNGNGEGSGSGSGGGQLSGGGGGNNSGKAKGKGADQIADLPDPSDLEFQEIENPSAERKRPREDGDGKDVSEEAKQAARDFKREEWLKVLNKLEMSEHDAEKYEKYKDGVKTEIRELRVTLEGLEANQTERVWLKNQTTGDIDDTRLVDGLTGERSIYKRRADQSPDSAFFQPFPKKLHFVFDLSMSMGRYAADGRLQRSLEAAVMIMEATKGFEHKFDIKFTGHSGDSDNVDLGVGWGNPPKNDKERLDVIRKMNAHIQACDSGDTTVQAVRKAIDGMARDGREADGRYIFAISDANLDQYSIGPEHFERLVATAMKSNIHLFVLFIASMGDQAQVFQDRLPGKVFSSFSRSDIPKTLKKMFLAAASAAKI